MGKPLDYNFVKSEIEKINGYKLLSSDYINNSEKLKIKCPNNHIFEMCYNNFIRGNRCRFCKINERKLDFDFVKEYIKKSGYKYISGDYINNASKIKVQCPNNHIYEIKFNPFKDQNNRCIICAGLKKYEFNEIKNYIESFNFKLLSKEYNGAQKKLKVKCPNNHIYDVTWADFKFGYRCKKCYFDYNQGMNHSRWNPNKDLIKKLRKNIRKSWVKKYMKEDILYDKYIQDSKQFNIDHIIPIKAGSDYLVENNLIEDNNVIQKMRNILNQKNNLRIIYKKDNYIKNYKYDLEDFKNFLKNNDWEY